MKTIDIYINCKIESVSPDLLDEVENTRTFLYPEVEEGFPVPYAEIFSRMDQILTTFDVDNTVEHLNILTTSEHLIRRLERRVAEGAQVSVTYYFVDGSSAKLRSDATIEGDWPEDLWQEAAEEQLALNEIWRRADKKEKMQELVDLERKIAEASSAILALPPDFDENGSLPPTKETLDKAAEYLILLFECWGDCFPIPDISVGPEASVDVLFSNEKWKILLNFDGDDKISWACFRGEKCASSAKFAEFANKLDFVNFFHNTYFHLAMTVNRSSNLLQKG